MRYHDITKDDMNNGESLRVVLWVAGCSHCCPECQNPLTWDPNGGLLFDQNAKDEVFGQLDKDYIAGITFSGGDPLHPANLAEVTSLAKEIREKYPDKTIWLYTGSVWEEVKNLQVTQYLDVMVDGEYKKEERDVLLMWRGSKNQRVIDVKASLECDKVVLHCGDYYKNPFSSN